MKKYRVELGLITFGIVVLILFFLSQQNVVEEKGLSDLVQTIGVPLDDVYIHCRYAENVLAGNGYCFNPGKMVTADTSPLWVLLIAFGGLFTSHLEVVAVLLSAFFYLVVAVGVYRLSLVLGVGRNWSAFIGVLTMLSGRIAWTALSGMEVSLACALVIGSLWSYLTGRDKVTAILLALGVATRPEVLLLAGILFADRFIQVIKKEANASGFFVSLTAFVVCVLPVFLLPLIERGSLIYHSSEVQGARIGGGFDIGHLWFSTKILLTTVTPPVVIGLLSIYFFRSDRRYRLIQLFAFGLPVALAFIAPQYRHHGRYFFPVIPLVIILGITVIANLLRQKRRFWAFGAVLLLAIHAVLVFIRWDHIYSYAVTNITGQHVAAAKWVDEHASASDVIAAHDVGAIGYFTDRSLIDLVGLVTPEFYPLQHDQKLVWDKARTMGATVFIIYNRLNPTLYEYAKDSLVLETSFRVEPLVSSADTVLSIYRVKEHATF